MLIKQLEQKIFPTSCFLSQNPYPSFQYMLTCYFFHDIVLTMAEE